MRERLSEYDIVASEKETPITLVGPPSALRGQVELHNPGDVKVVLREAKLRDDKVTLGVGPLRRAFHPLVLRPATSRVLPLSLSVDPTTPPGEYHFSFEVGGHSRPAVVHVAENFDLEAAPGTIVVENRPGVAQHKRLVITNTGNVPFTVGDIGPVGIEDELIACRSLHKAFDTFVERDDPRLEDFAVDTLKHARGELARGTSLDVRNGSGPTEVPPGDTAAIELEITAPEGLHSTSRYRGVGPLFTADIEFVVVPARGVSEVEQPERETTPAAAKRASARKATPKKSAAVPRSTKKQASKRRGAQR
jgi:hypothetical protein